MFHLTPVDVIKNRFHCWKDVLDFAGSKQQMDAMTKPLPLGWLVFLGT